MRFPGRRKREDGNNFPAIKPMTQCVLIKRDAHYSGKKLRAKSLAAHEISRSACTRAFLTPSRRTPRQMGDFRSPYSDPPSAPRTLQLQVRYLTKDFLHVLNVSDGEKSFVKFSTRRKILC